MQHGVGEWQYEPKDHAFRSHLSRRSNTQRFRSRISFALARFIDPCAGAVRTLTGFPASPAQALHLRAHAGRPPSRGGAVTFCRADVGN
jgi:hypothetical protein